MITANGAAALTVAQAPAAAGFTAIGAHTGANLAATVFGGDAVAATAAEDLAGAAAYGAVVHSAILANNVAYATAYAALTAAEQVIVTDLVTATVQGQIGVGNQLVQDVNTGAITGFIAGTDVEISYNAITTAIAAATDTAAITALVPTDATDLIPFVALSLNAVVASAEDQASDAAVMAVYNSLLASVDAVAAADASSQVAAIEAANVATVSLGVDNIDIDGGVATTGNDVFLFNEANGNMTVGTAATAAAPENVQFGAGDDSVIIAGEYTYVTIATAAEFAALGTTAVGDAATLEVFVYQNATTGDTVLSFEDNAFDGSTTTGTAMTTLTLTDITWTGVDVNVVDGNTILTEAAAVIA